MAIAEGAQRPQAPLRVALDGRVISDHFPGIGRYAYQLADALGALAASEAADLELLLLHQPGQRDARFDLQTLARWPALRLLPIRAPVFGLASQWRIPRLLRRSGAQVWHATYWLGAWHTGLPTVLSLYDLIGRRLPGALPSARGRLLGLALQQALRGADAVLTISEAARRDILASGVPVERVTVTPLAADPRFAPRPASEIAALRARLGLPERYALYLGINKPHKNLETLIRSWGRLAEARADRRADTSPVELVIAGRWDPRYPEARRLAERLPSGARPRFLGPVDEADLPALYSGAAVFAFPSRYEGFGLPPLEAMACGTPVVAAAASSLPEVVGDAGLLVAPDDLDGWARSLGRVLDEPGLAADLAGRGRARAASFSWAATARRTLAVYRQLAGRG